MDKCSQDKCCLDKCQLDSWNLNEPPGISVSLPTVVVSSATPASSSTISPTHSKTWRSCLAKPSPCAVMYERRISPESLGLVRDVLSYPDTPRPGTSQKKAKDIYFCEICDIEDFKTLKEFVRHVMARHKTPPLKQKLEYYNQYCCNTERKKQAEAEVVPSSS